ncbi:16S rRNA (cytidine(1402)-2'-O)-methyltransferase [Eggerthellaceae bacterium zg-893]|nr:16S rRNA (cytidine(1402)-2'-O)-methyltransferase [Eggerthellaceae bacterium zg-893]
MTGEGCAPVKRRGGKLVVCPTPLGNLGDMTRRAIEALDAADAVCAEDTRVTGKLLSAFGLEKRLERLDEALVGQRSGALAERVLAGEVIAYCSDAGMPGVSDPGLRLVRAVRQAGGTVEVLPGPTAVSTAYVASGCANARFYFGGFFPRKDAERRALLEGLRTLDAALVFYESPNRLVSALVVMAEAFPLREASVCRELTKLHEEVVTLPLPELRDRFAERERAGALRGEIVVVIDGPSEAEAACDQEKAADAARVRARELKAEGMRGKDVAKALAQQFGIPRNVAYDIALEA